MALHRGNFRLPRTPDGVPFFLLGENPAEWNAAMLVAFGKTRYATTTNFCNFRFLIDDKADHFTHLMGMAYDALVGHGLCEGELMMTIHRRV